MLRSLIFAACLAAAPAAAQEASFDCKKAGTPVEKAICEGNYLPALDGALAKLYRAALDKAGAKRPAVEAAQRQWLAARNTRCNPAKPDIDCLSRLYQARIVALARDARGATGGFVTGAYAYREKAQSGEMFLAEMPDGTTLVLIDTVNVGHQSPHTCSYADYVKEREGDVLRVRDAQASKTCGLEVAVRGNRAAVRETPKDCFDFAQFYCGAHGYMLGNYVKR